MSVSPSMKKRLANALRDIGDSSPIIEVQPLQSGFTSTAQKVITGETSYFMKWKANAPVDMFAIEARGLELLSKVGRVQVPNVLAVSDVSTNLPAFMIQEWIEIDPAASRSQLGEQIGRQLAIMHWVSSFQNENLPGFGLDHNTYNGTTLQVNSWDKNWVSFFREYRLRPQIEQAESKGLLPPTRRKGLDLILERLDTLLGRTGHRPSLLHGDFWNGNVLADARGQPVLIDPCIYYGDREVDLASSTILGGFPDTFYAAYQEVWPLSDDWLERRHLYNLYHYLRGLNGIGESQGPRIDAIIHRFVE